jgi:hypothetical protein
MKGPKGIWCFLVARPETRSAVPETLIERWFGLLTDKLIRRGVHTSVQALENDIREWIATWNDNTWSRRPAPGPATPSTAPSRPHAPGPGRRPAPAHVHPMCTGSLTASKTAGQTDQKG